MTPPCKLLSEEPSACGHSIGYDDQDSFCSSIFAMLETFAVFQYLKNILMVQESKLTISRWHKEGYIIVNGHQIVPICQNKSLLVM